MSLSWIYIPSKSDAMLGPWRSHVQLSTREICAMWILMVSIAERASCYDIFSEVYIPGRSGTLLDHDDEVDNLVITPKFYRAQKQTKFTGSYNGSLFRSWETRDMGPKVPLSDLLAWETTWTKTGKRVMTYVDISGENVFQDELSNHFDFTYQNQRRPVAHRRRRRREVYGVDDRSYIPVASIGQAEPFLYTVKISTGCTGILVSPRHVLTAAHCIHDQTDYVDKTRNMHVGLLSGNSSIEWIPVTQTVLSRGWVDGRDSQKPFFDYALLKLARKHNRPHIKLSISETDHHGTGERIYFTSFEDDKPDNTLWYRSCTVEEDDSHFLYHFCDARPGSSGSGVYAWNYNMADKQWNHALVGVFSGNRWRVYDPFYLIARNFNVAVRLTRVKYAQICEWMGKEYQHLCNVPKTRKKKNISPRHTGIQLNSKERTPSAFLRKLRRNGK